LWIIIKGKVYDVTSYVEEHPGGASILKNAGCDLLSRPAKHPPAEPIAHTRSSQEGLDGWVHGAAAPDARV
jgi:hypothetical protein